MCSVTHSVIISFHNIVGFSFFFFSYQNKRVNNRNLLEMKIHHCRMILKYSCEWNKKSHA